MSILPSYEYDIYISYHHNEAILSWVREFAGKLEAELDATVKDKLSIYYAQQGVGAELNKEEFDRQRTLNLRSLIFIPVISNNYCDTKKYNWEKEFQVFKQMAATDGLGLDLEPENVSTISRILPVKIHDVEKGDLQMLERELGGSMRSVNFIYDSMEGVNRPLYARDDEMKYRMNTVLFRNQINKTANFIADVLKKIKEKDGGRVQIEESSEDARSKHTVFLAWTAPDCNGKRDELSLILQKAGMDVIPVTDCPQQYEAVKTKITDGLSRSHCSVHILGGAFGPAFLPESQDEETDTDGSLSLPEYQVAQAMKKITRNGANFKQFIWQCPVNYSIGIEPKQEKFINDIRNKITTDIIYTNVPTPMQLVDDILDALSVKEKPVVETHDTEVFFICNKLDCDDAKEITDLLADVVSVQSLIISPEEDKDYREMVFWQMKKSKLAVVYFKEATGWAQPFTEQIWKQAGGASSNTPVLMIGDDSVEANREKKFKAPKGISKIVAKDIIALEIKATYDKVMEGNIAYAG